MVIDMLMEKYPDHEVTEWFKRAWCINDGDSVIKTGSYLGMCIISIILMSLMKRTMSSMNITLVKMMKDEDI